MSTGIGPNGNGRVVLYEGDRTRVTRVTLTDGSSAILKEPLGTSGAARRRHERRVLQRLAGIAGVVQLASGTGGAGDVQLAGGTGDDLLLHDTGGGALPAAPIEPDRVVDLAIEVAAILAQVHRRGVIHKDITPANLVVSGRAIQLIDFDLATTFAQEWPAFTHQSEVAGTLQYLAPEQTGRTGWPVDLRADLYGLGATLYELATGQPPFAGDDPLTLIHDHLARAPLPPAVLNPAVPAGLSGIILRLLEKVPAQRYQSAEGLGHDLHLLREARRAGDAAPFPLGGRDFPPRLAAPSRLVGRDPEVEALRAVFDGVLAGERRGVLISGPPGVGKTMLIDALRPMVAAHDGWFVTGQFDQYRRDHDADGIRRALRSLVRLLLGEPDEEIGRIRERIAAVVGANLGLAAAVFPELARLMKVTPETPEGESRALQARLRKTALDLLRAIASPRRPVVMVLDDLQRATAYRLELVHALMSDETVAGLLVVGAYRDTELDAAHPLQSVLARWQRLGTPPVHLTLANLPAAAVQTLLGDLLRIDERAAAPLAGTIARRTDGNPYDTLELLNALRRDGVLVPGIDGWQCNADDLHRHVGRRDVLDLLGDCIDELPASTRGVLEIMACLGGEVEVGLLAAAAGLDVLGVNAHLLPALEDGRLVVRQSEHHVRFRHDRVRQAAFGRRDAQSRTALRLTLARRVAERPGFGAVAAEQYLLAKDLITDPGEARRAAELLRDAARRAQLLADDALVERYATGALELITGGPDDRLYLDLLTMRHSALVGQARFDAADEIFARITATGQPPIVLTPAIWAQIYSLNNRRRLAEAVSLGLDLLARLGHPRPDAADRGAEVLAAWAAAGDAEADLRRAEVDDPLIIAIAGTVGRLINPSFVGDQPILTWLLVQAAELWSAHGPMAALMGALSHAILLADMQVGKAITQRVIAVGAARGYEPETAEARLVYASSIGHWFEPLEVNIPRAQEARERLLQGGDPLNASLTFYSTLPNLLDCSSTLDGCRSEIEAAIGLTARTGNHQFHTDFMCFRQFVRAMRGETTEPGGFSDEAVDERDLAAGPPGHPAIPFNYHPMRALSAAIFGDVDRMTQHSRAALDLWPLARLNHVAVYIQLLRALALAAEARTTGSAAALGDLDACRDWFAERAADGPDNLRHLLHLVVAERAWATDTPAAAGRAFDAALRDVARVRRPWHQALITERAAAFLLAYGMRYLSESLLREARRHYAGWGASAKVAELDRRYPALQQPDRRPAAEPELRAGLGVAGAGVDLLGVLTAAQALSAETSLDRLPSRVTATLGTLTGATEVRLVLRESDTGRWRLHVNGAPPVPLDEADAGQLLPLAPLRYVERTAEPLVVDDATNDDRFARDPYLAGLAHCSLLAVPILTRGRPSAILVLENRLGRGAFTAERLDTVLLVAGQLAVSLDNARLVASLERKAEELTAALAVANERLERLSVTDALTGLANRRRFSDVVDSEWWRAVRPRQPLAIAVVDIDHFTQFNDHYGQLAGDQCLQRVAAAISECVRTMDLVARYSGEEFAVVLPGVDLAASGIIAERIRDAVIALEEPHEQSPYGVVTVSVGVASVVPSWDANPKDLIEAADRQLHEAKRRGRNQVMTV